MNAFLRRLITAAQPHRWFLVWLVGWMIYLTRFWSGVFFFDQAGNLNTTHINVWGDWAAHFTMGSRFGYRSLWPDESPFLAGAAFSYPFAMNWISGVLIRLGVPFLQSFIIPSWILASATIIALYVWFYTWLGSTKKALTASTLMLCNGGLGFIWMLRHQLQHASTWQEWLQLPFQATNQPEQGIRWLSMVDSMLIPQRAFALGFPWALLGLTLVYRWLVVGKRPSPVRHVALGIWLGVLPIIHTHSFLAVGVVIAGWLALALWTEKPAWSQLLTMIRAWLIVGSTTLLVAVPLYLIFFAHQVGGFITWQPGWLAAEFKLNWLDFWLRNWGPTLIVGLAGLLMTFRSKNGQRGWPFLIWFILPNLILFQPWSWDNTKLLIWSAVGISGFATLALAQLWRTQNTWMRNLVIAIFSIAILSGAIDLYWIQRRDLHTYQMYSRESWHLAQWVRENTSPDSRWLTGAEHNHWLFNLTGRQPLMAYRGWLWTQGYEYQAQEKIVTDLFARPTLETLQKAGVLYVVLGPEEMNVWGGDVERFALFAESIFVTDHTQILKISAEN